jgi:N-ethylmaleimide reductase
MGDSDPAATFGYVVRELDRRGVAFVLVREYVAPDSLGPQLKRDFRGVYIANEGLDQASATQLLAKGDADAAAFGRLFIANPDLLRRFAQGAPLNTPDPETFYGGGAHGYVDYPSLAEAEAPL